MKLFLVAYAEPVLRRVLWPTAMALFCFTTCLADVPALEKHLTWPLSLDSATTPDASGAAARVALQVLHAGNLLQGVGAAERMAAQTVVAAGLPEAAQGRFVQAALSLDGTQGQVGGR
jgi:hypothetical protein